MNDLRPTNQPAVDLSALSSGDLRAELARGLTLTAHHFSRLAAVWGELERRGEDLSDLRRSIGGRISQIAAGLLAAEVVVAFYSRPSVLDAVLGIPLDRQRELAAGGTVSVLAPNEANAEAVTLFALPPAAVRLVFAGGVERTPQEQRAALVARRPKKEKTTDRNYRVVVDAERRTVTIGRMTVPVESVLAALAGAASGVGVTAEELRQAKDTGQGVAIAQCYLTEDEDARLKAICKAKKADRGELVRRAVVAMLLL